MGRLQVVPQQFQSINLSMKLLRFGVHGLRGQCSMPCLQEGAPVRLGSFGTSEHAWVDCHTVFFDQAMSCDAL